MDIDEQILELVSTTSRTEQMVRDLSDHMNRVIPYMANEHKELTSRVGKIENRQYWMSGVGSAVGLAIGALTGFIKHS